MLRRTGFLDSVATKAVTLSFNLYSIQLDTYIVTNLLFEKINGFKDTPSVNAAHAAFIALAERKGWNVVATDKAGVFNPFILRRFDAVVWNNISGDVLTLSQRRAFEFALLFSVPFVAAFLTVPDEIMRAMFARGAFSRADALAAGATLANMVSVQRPCAASMSSRTRAVAVAVKACREPCGHSSRKRPS